MPELRVEQFLLPHNSVATSNPFYSTLEAKRGTKVWGLTDGDGFWFRHCWLAPERAEACLDKWKATGITPQSLAVNVCTDTTYAILTA